MDRGTLIAGRYELAERLGRGGMGEVWAGRDRDLHRDVAVKFLLDGAGTPADLLHRFEREAVAAAQINHPNVVALYDRGVHDGLRFMVMERVEGATLAAHMRSGRPMEPARALGITEAICAALAAAHSAKVVHYDIKPSNVMLTSDGRVKVVDFGIAGFSHTHTYTVAPTAMLAPAGTASYGAPEQFLGLPHRRPWSLHVGPRGIATWDPRCATPSTGPAGQRVFPWDEIQTVSLERTAAGRYHRCNTLRVRFREADPHSGRFRPAGWIAREVAIPDLEEGQSDRMPVCVLGPMDEQQHGSLIAALVRHAGPRWSPRTGP
ncbi:protein kinase domain-containing protein [Actinomadura coerulea]|uniref:protein kinase domain-containing protein n=1 Tax=Actinomadura coerulea TaxID=46159 RepID=UPI00343961C0